MGQSSSKKYVVEEDDSFVDVGVDTPFSDWLEYLKTWGSLDSKKGCKEDLVSMLDYDINNSVKHDHESFWTRYSPMQSSLGTLGCTALEVTRANFLLWDNGSAPSNICV